MSETLYIVMPAYNEEDSIQQVLEQWYPVVASKGQSSKFLVLNDGSKDSTFEILQQYAKSHPQLVPIDKQNSGHGATILEGYKRALEAGADYIFQTDSDGQTCPEEFDWFWEHRNDADMIIGNRTQRQDGISRVIVTKTLKAVVRLRFNVKLPDANAPFRLMTRDSLIDCIQEIPNDYGLSNVLLAVLYAKKNYPVISHPISFKPRQGGGQLYQS